MANTKMTDVEAEALDTVLDAQNWTTLHEDKESGDLADAAHIVSILVADQPGSSKVVGYRKYNGVVDTSIISEPGFLVLTKRKITGPGAVAILVPTGTKYIETDSAYVLGRDHGISVTKAAGTLSGKVLEQGGQGYKDAAATVVASIQSVARMTLHSGGIDPLAVARREALSARVEEFFNHAHGKGGRFTSGGAGGGTSANVPAGTSTKTTGQRVASIAKKAAIVAGIAAVAVGVVVLAGHSQRDSAARQKHNEALDQHAAESQKRWDGRRASDNAFLDMAAKVHTQNAAVAKGRAASDKHDAEDKVAREARAGLQEARRAKAGLRAENAGTNKPPATGHLLERYNPGVGKTADERLRSRDSARLLADRDASTAKRRADQAAQEKRLPKSTAGEYFD